MSKEATGGMDRRGALRLALAAAIAPTFASSQAQAQAVTGGLIDPPTGPMTYRRTVSRDLVDGKSFSVSRFFTVEFHRFAEGFMVHGQQVDVAVNAPEELSPFAGMEAARDESGLFPLAIDPFGLMLSYDQHAAAGPAIQQAVDRTLSALRDQQMLQEERAMLSAFVAAVHSAGNRITAHMPVDLFAPAGPLRQEELSIALPDGGEGHVVTRFSGETDSNTGLMRFASREIVTEVGDNRRMTSESWNLARG